MLSLTFALAVLVPAVAGPQQPATAAYAAAVADPRATVVEGTIELSRAEAESAAMELAEEAHRAELRERGHELAAELTPVWLPHFMVRRHVDHWVRRQERKQPLRVLGLETSEHNYSYGTAYRTEVHVAPTASLDRSETRRLERSLQEAGKLLLAKFGGIAVAWGVLAFLCSWLDRLSRGYMTWRLRFLTSACGLVLSALVLLV